MGRIICSRFGDSLLGLLTPSPASPPQLLCLVARHGGRRHPHVPGMPSAVIAHIPSIGNSHLWHRPSSRLSWELSRREERSRNYKALRRCSASPPRSKSPGSWRRRCSGWWICPSWLHGEEGAFCNTRAASREELSGLLCSFTLRGWWKNLRGTLRTGCWAPGLGCSEERPRLEEDQTATLFGDLRKCSEELVGARHERGWAQAAVLCTKSQRGQTCNPSCHHRELSVGGSDAL